ncbi:hypothetical protein M0R45_008108 [Rubus argutus]|uniref:UEV domain-containing protein n=1 Tax=Rubus argutus TaxID=59490 RepID=A0AAW1Y144_RUBAR
MALKTQNGNRDIESTPEDTIRRHLDALASACTSLEHGMALLKHRDGHVASLHKLQGTFPTSFQGEIYNTPIVIWLLETYPRSAPYVHLNPTKDMAVKQPHSYVDPSGVVSIPYLQNWVYPSSNLVDLISKFSASFSRHPPLFTRRPKPPP